MQRDLGIANTVVETQRGQEAAATVPTSNEASQEGGLVCPFLGLVSNNSSYSTVVLEYLQV